MSSETQVVVIGGGIVGLATALALTARGVKPLVLEKEAELAAHQTGHNSGVIHSGLYYRPGSLKARFAVEGTRRIVAFCREHDLPHDICGKVVVAVDETEVPRLLELHRRAQANGVPDVELVGPERLREIEPHAAGIQALVVPGTGIVDFAAVARRYAELVEERGGEVRRGSGVRGLRREGERWIVESARDAVRTPCLINCAGLQCDRIARLAGAHPHVRIIPFRGEYHRLAEEREGLVRALIYPVPDPAFPFLGVHFTRMIHGGVEAGPNAVLAFRREGYRKTDVSPRDLFEMGAFPGFWRMARSYWRTGIGEMVRSFSKRAFVRALQRLLPDLREADLAPGGAGVRAQAVDRQGRLVDDFWIEEGPAAIHVLNAPSPAATASLPIGEAVARRAATHFGWPS